MARKAQQPPTNQTANGSDNIQVVGSNNSIEKVTQIFHVDTEAQRARRNRRAMLELVRNTWIKGVLEQSLYNEVLIELGMEERPGAVDHPWEMQVYMPNQINRTLPPESSIIDIFDETSRALLILGGPGSGKSTMLLELARDSITRAEQDDTQPIPVVFNLSSWTDQQSIDDWLVNELNVKYHTPKKLAQNWIINDDLQLLLDGLDEVRLENREACVKAINDFRQAHGLTSITVCSRISDYETLKVKLNLSGAVLLQPLSPEQIDNYFADVGPELDGAYQALKNDGMLQELVKQPLFLSIMTLAYRGTNAAIFVPEKLGTLEARRRHLFDTYIQKMFARVARTKNEYYTPEQTKRWLAWLAQEMLERGQSIFQLERIRRDWLKSQNQQTLHKAFSVLCGSLLPGLITAFATFAAFGKITYGAIIGCVVSIMFFSASMSEGHTEKTRWSWKSFWSALLKDWKVGLATGLGLLAVTWYFLGFLPALAGGLAGVFIFGFLGGFEVSEIETKTKVNQGIILSIKNAIIFGLITGIAFGVISTWEIGLANGLLWGLTFGGIAVINHYSLRFLLLLNGYMPLNLVRFLDFSTDRLFLRRVGGGYIFVHRLLLEHFAAMYPDTDK